MYLLEPQEKLFQHINRPGWDLALSHRGGGTIEIATPSQLEAIDLIQRFSAQLTQWLYVFGADELNIRYKKPRGGSPFRIPRRKSLEEPSAIMNSQEILSIPEISLPKLWLCPSMATILLEMLQFPERNHGLVRISDDQQILFGPAFDNLTLNPGHTQEEALKWKRPDYMFAPDYAELKRETHMRLEPDNPDSWVDYTWRSFDPDLGPEDERGWLLFTNRYRLVQDATGSFHHFSQSLGVEEIAKPVYA